MADWSMLAEWPPDRAPGTYGAYPCLYPRYQDGQCQLPAATMPSPPQAQPTFKVPQTPAPSLMPQHRQPVRYNELASTSTAPPPDSPREIRNKAEKQRRDKLNQSIAQLASLVPPVTASSRKIDKTGVLRLTAHYLRAYQYVFGDSIDQALPSMSAGASQVLLTLLNGFLLTITYKGLIVVVSQNVNKYLGYSELELLGQSIFSIIHEEDHQLLRDQMIPRANLLGPNGELLVPDEVIGKQRLAAILENEKRGFLVRFKKFSQRSEPTQYVTCHIEGSFRKSDRACRGYNRCCQMVRRARARGDNPCASGNDVVFISIVRPTTETFITETGLESFRMEYRTRHSIDGEIIQSEQRIALVTGYMTHEVTGVNAMNFMHRDDVRWVIIALREMYDQHRLFGESCYRLMTKNGQFIYMRTRGRLDVDYGSRAVTSFVCTNTVVGEQEGKHLIKMMKKKFTMILNNNEELPPEEDIKDVNDSLTLPVEDPRKLEKVILHLVTNLPSPQPEDSPNISPLRGESPPMHLAIIPPKRERIISAIGKIYTVIKTFSIDPRPSRNSSKQERKETLFKPIQAYITETQTDHADAAKQLSTYRNVYLRQPTPLVSDFDLAGPSNCVQPSTSGLYSGSMSLPQDSQQMSQGTKIKYHVVIAPNVPTEYSRNRIVEVNTAQPGPSGIKRPIESIDEDSTLTKKKTTELLCSDEVDFGLDLNESSLDNVFGNSFTNSQQMSEIDTAINSLEQIIRDPTFPDLLISKEVQDILGEIDKEQDNN